MSFLEFSFLITIFNFFPQITKISNKFMKMTIFQTKKHGLIENAAKTMTHTPYFTF